MSIVSTSHLHTVEMCLYSSTLSLKQLLQVLFLKTIQNLYISQECLNINSHYWCLHNNKPSELEAQGADAPIRINDSPYVLLSLDHGNINSCSIFLLVEA